MATSFFTRVSSGTGKTTVFARFQVPEQKIDYRASTKMEATIKAWTNSRLSAAKLENYKNSEEGKALYAVLDQIAEALDSAWANGTLTAVRMRELISDIRNRDGVAKEKADIKEKERVTLNKYIAQYIADVETGARQTDKGTNYAPSTVKSIKAALKQFEEFQRDTVHQYDFNDIDMRFYYDFTAWLKAKDYHMNSIGRSIKQLKVIMTTAEAEGFHMNPKWKDKKFKGTRVDVDTIYLTAEELELLKNADLGKLSNEHCVVRDIFLVGVWTAQRISDYNNIKKENFHTYVKKWVEQIPDAESPNGKKDVICSKEILYIDLMQEKTNARVTVPVSSELKTIFERYNYEIPHIADQVFNRYIKQCCQKAGITDSLTIKEVVGGKEVKTTKEKWELVTSHTARRTGATLMYLSGMDVYDIIKITGHASPAILKKYIRADELTVLQKITDNYSYFD